MINNAHKELKKKIAEEREKKHIEVENELNSFKETHKEELQKQIIEEIEKKRIQIENEILELQKFKDDSVAFIADLEKDYESLKLEIEEQHNKYSSVIEENEKLDIFKNELQNELERLQKETMSMSKQLEKFRSFVKDKADMLWQLEFIDEDQYNNILMKPEKPKETESFLDFKKDFNDDFPKAISYIQAYLFNKNNIYPRYIIEDFFALIQTNDLIILAGESGSGKTNLVKSFADAVGGVVKIIPVKPNWTSSEDLLGYYNPLEKRYLSTQFLDTLLEALNNPEKPYFICLDEMNLARVEYYFADFLSLLEERKEQPKIPLYSDDESGHTLSEFKNVLESIKTAKSIFNKNHLKSYIDILKDEKVNNELKRIFGFSDKDSLIKYHSDLRKMISGILNIPSEITFPKNVRIIGAINIDETTHYLSPKILDRAHIMKFGSPLLLDWDVISQEIDSYDFEQTENKIKFAIDDFGSRQDYPKFEKDTHFSKKIVDFCQDYFNPLGIEVGLRTIRQWLNYRDIFLQLNPDENLAFNNFILHKILPKMAFDGNKKVGDIEKKDILVKLKNDLEEILQNPFYEITENQGVDAITELEKMIKKAESNDWNVNYWA